MCAWGVQVDAEEFVEGVKRLADHKVLREWIEKVLMQQHGTPRCVWDACGMRVGCMGGSWSCGRCL